MSKKRNKKNYPKYSIANKLHLENSGRKSQILFHKHGLKAFKKLEKKFFYKC